MGGALFVFAARIQGAEPAAPAKPLTVKVAAIQCSSDLGAVDANRKNYRR